MSGAAKALIAIGHAKAALIDGQLTPSQYAEVTRYLNSLANMLRARPPRPPLPELPDDWLEQS